MKCASCDIDLSSDPLIINGDPYCCPGCGDGGPCNCTYEHDEGRYPRNGRLDPAAAPDVFEDGL